MNVETVAEQLLFTTVRVETANSSGATGTGTGFFFNYANGAESYPFLVTNKHVVAGGASGVLTFHTGRDGVLQLGKPFRLQISDFERMWTAHPESDVDVVVAPVAQVLAHLHSLGVTPFLRYVDRSIMVESPAINDLDALEEIVFIGYPAPVWDTVNFLPVIRRGTTATPVAIDYLGKKQFLVDASVFPGSSGSPVFLFNKGFHSNRQGNVTVGGRLRFLGLISAVHFQTELNETVLVPAPTVDVQATISKRMINLGIVFKASAVIHAIESCLVARGVALVRDAAASPPSLSSAIPDPSLVLGGT